MWQERLIAYVHTDRDVTESELESHLLAEVPDWWLPDQFELLDDIPRTSTGKYDKQTLRRSFKEVHDSLPK